MADDDQNQQPPWFWFPWRGFPQPPPPPRPSRPAVRPQLSRRLSPPSPAAAPSSPRRPSPSQNRQPATTTTATRGAAPPTPQSQVSRPSPSRSSPLGPIREPPQAPASNNSNAGGAVAPAPAKLPSIPAFLLLPAVPEAAPRQKDVDVVLPPERPVTQVQQPAAAEIKPHGHGKAADKEHKPHHKEEKEKEKKGEHKSKDKEKEKDHKEKKDETKSKEKEKDKKHHAGDDGKHEEAKADQGKLHREIKAGVAEMVHKASGSGHAAGSGTSVITLAGENKGASMKVSGGKSKDGGEWHGGHGYRLDGGSGSDGKKAAGKAGMMTALINSNVQVINNSLLLQSSCSGGDPGVHLKLSAKSNSKDKQKHAGGGDKAAAVGKK